MAAKGFLSETFSLAKYAKAGSNALEIYLPFEVSFGFNLGFACDSIHEATDAGFHQRFLPVS